MRKTVLRRFFVRFLFFYRFLFFFRTVFIFTVFYIFNGFYFYGGRGGPTVFLFVRTIFIFAYVFSDLGQLGWRLNEVISHF